MREALYELITNTIVYQYELPYKEKDIQKTVFSTDNDHCYMSKCNDSFVEIIYNSIIEYSHSEFDLNQRSYESLLTSALKTKIKYNEDANQETKIKYGFYGEVLLYSILHVLFDSPPAISRGYFYNPLEKSETKGYDSYHLIDTSEKLQLWFGEVKFHANHESGIKSVMKNIDKAISDNYLDTNMLSIVNFKHQINTQGDTLKAIIEEWEEKPLINPLEFLQKYNCELVYPILLIYEKGSSDYDENIKKAIDYINTKFKEKEFKLSINYKLFFILVPLDNVKTIKEDTIKCIESKKPVIF